jgi:hypothetical protein
MDDDLKKTLVEVVREAMAEHCASMLPCGISKEEHDEHHRLLKSATRARGIATTAVVTLISNGVVIALGVAVWEYVKARAGGHP